MMQERCRLPKCANWSARSQRKKRHKLAGLTLPRSGGDEHSLQRQSHRRARWIPLKELWKSARGGLMFDRTWGGLILQMTGGQARLIEQMSRT